MEDTDNDKDDGGDDGGGREGKDDIYSLYCGPVTVLGAWYTLLHLILELSSELNAIITDVQTRKLSSREVSNLSRF